jgi:hypothetical protein
VRARAWRATTPTHARRNGDHLAWATACPKVTGRGEASPAMCALAGPWACHSCNISRLLKRNHLSWTAQTGQRKGAVGWQGLGTALTKAASTLAVSKCLFSRATSSAVSPSVAVAVKSTSTQSRRAAQQQEMHRHNGAFPPATMLNVRKQPGPRAAGKQGRWNAQDRVPAQSCNTQEGTLAAGARGRTLQVRQMEATSEGTSDHAQQGRRPV